MFGKSFRVVSQVVAGTALSLPLAFVLQGLTGFRTPGAIISGIVLESGGNCGFLSCLKYGLAISIGTDALFVFLVICIITWACFKFRKSVADKKHGPGSGIQDHLQQGQWPR